MKSSDHQHVPGVAIIPDPAHHPRSTSGADDDLKNTNTKCSAYCKMPSISPYGNGLVTLALGFLVLFFICFVVFFYQEEVGIPQLPDLLKIIVLTKEMGSTQVLFPFWVF